jgi:hypothetical protein
MHSKFRLLAGLALLSLLLAACAGADTQPTAEPTAAATESTAESTTEGSGGEAEMGDAQAAQFVPLSDINNNPANYVGQTVITRGDFIGMVGDNAIQLDDPALLGFDTVLVIGVSEEVIPGDPAFFTPGAGPDANLEITGMVRHFDQAEVEDRLDMALEEGIRSEYDGGPVILAEHVRPLTSADYDPSETRQDELEPEDVRDPGEVTLSEIADEPERYFGRYVTIRGDFMGMIGEHAFALDDPALLDFDTLLVIGADSTIVPQDPAFFTPGEEANANVEVTGMVREFAIPEAANSEVDYDLDPEIFSEYNSNPVLVADEIRLITSE